MEKKSTFRRTAENYQSNRKVNNGKFNVSYKERDSTHKEKNNYLSNYSTENAYNNIHRSSQSNFALDNSMNSCKESNRKNIDVVRLENGDLNKMKLLIENTIKDKNKVKEIHPKSKDVDMESSKKHKLGLDCSKINKSENSNTDLSSTKTSKVSQLKEAENVINSFSNTKIDTHKRKSSEINKNKKLHKNSNKKSTKELEANKLIICESEKKSTKTDESDKKSSKTSSSKSEGKRRTSSNEIGVIKKKFKNDSGGIIKCDGVFNNSPLPNFPPEKYFSSKFSENQTIIPTVQIKEVLSESMTHNREEVKNRKINNIRNEKNVKNLDNKINESIKPIEVKKNLTKKLKDEYENKLTNLKNEYEIELCRLKNEYDSDLLKLNEQLNIQEREPVDVLTEEDSSEDDSSIDDIEIIEMTEEKNIITVSSSSESESDSLDSDVEVIIKSNNITENKMDEIKKNNESNIQVPNEIKRNSLSKNPIPQNADESFQLLFPKSTVEPALDTILVNKQDNSFITDLKVFDNRLFVGDSHGILRQYDMKTHECVANYFGHSNIVHCIFPTTSPFGIKQLFTGGYDNKILIHNIEDANVMDSLKTTSPIMSICESNEIIYIGTSIGVVYVHSLRGQCFKKEFIVSEDLVCISSIKEGMKSLLFIGFKSGEISVWDADTHIKIRDISVRDHVGIPIGFVALIKQRLLVYCKNSIHFIYYASEKSPVTFNHFSQNNSLCQTKNYTIIGNNVGTIYVLRTSGSVIGKTPVVTYNNSDSPILSLTFYNNTIISGDKKGNVFFNRLIEP